MRDINCKKWVQVMTRNTCLLLCAAQGQETLESTTVTTIQVINSCKFAIELYDNDWVQVLQPKVQTTRQLTLGTSKMLRHGRDPQATLGEFHLDADGHKFWYDISIIPPGSDNCDSWWNCKAHTQKKGFNVPLAVLPQSNVNGANCVPLKCLQDGCADAYQFPKDDKKSHNCPGSTPFQLVFCPTTQPHHAQDASLSGDGSEDVHTSDGDKHRGSGSSNRNSTSGSASSSEATTGQLATVATAPVTAVSSMSRWQLPAATPIDRNTTFRRP